MPEGGVTLVDLWGDFREFRGEMTTRMTGFERQLGDGLAEMRYAVTEHKRTEAKLTQLEDHELAKRVQSLESNWRIAIWLGAALAVLVLGLVGEAIRTMLFG